MRRLSLRRRDVQDTFLARLIGGGDHQDLAVLEVEPPATFPFDLVWRDRPTPATLTAILDVARRLRDQLRWLAGA